jgi:hypothetical protein
MAEIRKSSFFSICGWVALVCIAVAFGVPLFEVTTGIRVPRTVWPGLSLVAFFPLALVWLVGTLVHRSRIKRARIQAEAFVEAAQRMEGWPRGPTASYPLPPVPAGGVLGLTSPPAPPQSVRTASASSYSSAVPDVYTYSAPGMPMCPACGQRPIIFYCSTHGMVSCLDCVMKHDKPGECVYIPAYRAPKDAAKPPGGGKTGSVFGIS